MKDLVLHPKTARQLQAFMAAPVQASVLVGPAGSGKKTLAARLAEAVLNINSLTDYPYGVIIQPVDGKAIGIEAARQLEHFLSLKVPGKASLNRAVVITDAHLLTIEAQNALLKTLEEPPAGTVLLLTASNLQALLPTIRSRLSALNITRPDKQQLLEHFTAQFPDEAVSQAYAVSGGLPGLMRALLAQADHPLLEATDQARQLLSQTAYERLLKVDELSKQRQLARDVSYILQQMAQAGLLTADDRTAAKWQNVLTASYDCAEALDQNAQPKLALTTLMLSL